MENSNDFSNNSHVQEINEALFYIVLCKQKSENQDDGLQTGNTYISACTYIYIYNIAAPFQRTAIPMFLTLKHFIEILIILRDTS